MDSRLNSLRYQLIFVYVLAIYLVGCKREMATFAYHPEQYPSIKKTPSEYIISTKRTDYPPTEIERPTSSNLNTETLEQSHVLTIPTETRRDWPLFTKKKKTTSNKKSSSRVEERKKPFQTLLHSKSSNQKKKNIKKNYFFNDEVKIGGLFLGGAILLSLANLTGLAVLFGLASLFFLYLGFKKYFRKQRKRRRIKQKNK